ncbi:acyl-CoA dehydrogenase family protein (plasmid) [Aminobacter sp. NyZ550]|jgi:alkylation response protein AidB-like acyl-CoA dehydrogenase|uniref:Cyclohexane-1-carbonyl-CoA dehydrogenase n=1 Tax=Aminobacter aminovorans TaxID=83263 RepID=A0AAC8YUX5_AMIAI|nr:MULTISPECIES: acyl-CoA dehydrogenase family protein [Aminobacter]AMS44633.1 acyl-CoA dehydrogenase [Aminobacter aminovorans]MBB3708408.1 alkylation response protein AidB-like acyl-CoA dehydrogenase [Aminobacter aminovorans]MRX32199.1 acyl-CoA dehydrogenase [Aminobacter sp. MDW-2]WAX98217.1 acyl-CoA dehydrogenase family protein [Aminobacter sp. NyZ550]WMD00296.1 acyl-CoA dehydrogenase family protein [Aminobacter niigataensis]
MAAHLMPTSAPTRDHLDWPFFADPHRALAAELDAFIASGGLGEIDHGNADGACKKLVAALGQAGILRHCVPAAFGGASDVIDSRSLCLIRETLAYADGLADFAFAMQGLGTGAISLSGTDELKQAILPKIARGELISAFALTEPEAGSDVAAMSTSARRDGDTYVLDGEKVFISNGGIADVYTVFARTGEAPGTRGISAFVVYADTPGFSIAERIETIAPHPLARVRFDDCRIPASQLLGEPGEGFKIAMRTLDIFRPSVAAAALGFARRALDEAVAHARSRKMFGATLADLPTAQSTLGEMATAIDAASLLTVRTAWRRDVQKLPITREAAMAKMTATENAQWVIDQALQLFGGRGVRVGEITERLYREIRALRIYEGATEVQKLIIGRELMKASR